jgi:tight adherence protein C
MALDANTVTLLYGPIAAGLAVAVLLNHLFAVVYRDRPLEAQEWEFETRRLMRLREQSKCICWFEPFINELSALCQTRLGEQLLDSLRVRQSVTQSLARLGTSVFYRWHEYVALSLFQGLLAGALCLVWLLAVSANELIWIAPAMLGLVFLSRINKLQSMANLRLHEFKKRLPFSIDLMALMMDAGATFMESLVTVVAENRENPVAEELGELHKNVMSGRTLNAGLEEMRARMRDATIDEIVFSIVNSEKLGTPKSVTLLRLAEQMRMRRSQTIEKAIGNAQTMMAFPGFVIMIACLLIVAAPFGIAALQQQ